VTPAKSEHEGHEGLAKDAKRSEEEKERPLKPGRDAMPWVPRGLAGPEQGPMAEAGPTAPSLTGVRGDSSPVIGGQGEKRRRTSELHYHRRVLANNSPVIGDQGAKAVDSELL